MPGSPKPEADTFLHWAAANGHIEIIGSLRSCRITIEMLVRTREHRGRTTLHRAACHRHRD